MKYIQLFFLEMLVACCLCNCSVEPEKPLIPGVPRITINCSLPADYEKLFPNPAHEDVKDITVLFWTPVDNLGLNTGWNSVVSKNKKGSVEWIFQSEKPVFITTAFQRTGVVLTPGDSIAINITANGITYSGKGAESLELQHKLEQVQNDIVSPVQYSFKISSLADYLKWNAYSNQRLAVVSSVMDAYMGKIPDTVFNIIKANTIYSIEIGRAEAFKALNTSFDKHKDPALTAAVITAVFDSTMNSSWAQWLRDCSDCAVPTWYFYQYNRIQTWKKSGFDLADDSSMNTENKRKIAYYNAIKENYKGLLRERLLQYVVADETVKHIGLTNPITDSILNDYYRQAGFPEYKQWMRNYVDSMRQHQKIAQKF